MKKLLLLFLGLSVLSCTAPDVTVKEADYKFFDLKGFVDQEIEKVGGKQVEKMVNLNGETETQTIQTLDLKKELEIFRSSDINKPSWYDKYEIEKKEGITRYFTSAEKLKTKELIVKYDGEKIKEIVIKNKINNQIYDTEETLIYTVGDGYSMSLRQKAVLNKENITEIVVKYL